MIPRSVAGSALGWTPTKTNALRSGLREYYPANLPQATGIAIALDFGKGRWQDTPTLQLQVGVFCKADG